MDELKNTLLTTAVIFALFLIVLIGCDESNTRTVYDFKLIKETGYLFYTCNDFSTYDSGVRLQECLKDGQKKQIDEVIIRNAEVEIYEREVSK